MEILGLRPGSASISIAQVGSGQSTYPRDWTPCLNSNQQWNMKPNLFSGPTAARWSELGSLYPSLTVEAISGDDILRDNALLARDCVPHAGPTQRVHALHNDKWCLLQGNNAQVVILLLFCLRTHTGPYIVLHLEWLVFPLAHLSANK